MNVLYLANKSQLDSHFLRGWKNAFHTLGARFDVANPKDDSFHNLVSNNIYDIIMGYSGVGIEKLPLQLLNANNTALVVSGLPFNSSYTSPDIQAPCANPVEVDFISRFNRKIVWSQWSPVYLNSYYSGYVTRGIPVICLPYAGDILTNGVMMMELDALNSKVLFVGNLNHRRRGNMSLIRNLVRLVPPDQIKIYGGNEWKKLIGLETKPTSPDIDINALYRSSLICPNIHTTRQKYHRTQLNDRTFNIAAAGAFQICDNPLVRDYFKEDEIICAENDVDYIEKMDFFLRHPDATLPLTAAALKRASRDHSYFNRIASLYESLGINNIVGVGDQFWKPFRVPTNSLPAISPIHQAQYFLETRFMATGRFVKRKIFKY